jgi:MFS family permease
MTAAIVENVTEQEDRRRWLMLAVLLLGQFMALVDTLIVNVAVPEIGADLHASGATLQLVVAGYTVAYAMLLVTGARLGAVRGRRTVYLAGVALFTLGSLGCGLAPNGWSLVALRCVQGAGAALLVPQVMSVVQTSFSGSARARAVSAYGVVLSSGAVVGIVLGGLVVNADLFGWSWRPAFFVNVPLGVLLLVAVPRLVPADPPRRRPRLDLPGLLTAIPAVLLVVLPLALGHELGWPVWTFAAIAAGLVLAGVFLLVERQAAARGGAPLLDLAVLRAPGLGAGLATLVLSQVAWGGYLFTTTLHLEAGLGDTPLRAGLTYLPLSAVFGLVGYHWRRLPARVQPFVAPVGQVCCLLGYLATPAGGLAGAAGMVLIGVGLGLTASPVITQSLLRVPAARAGDASGVVTTTIQLGQVVGVAGFGTLFLGVRGPVSGSAHAVSVTSGGFALVAVAAGACAALLTRSLRAPRDAGATPGVSLQAARMSVPAAGESREVTGAGR